MKISQIKDFLKCEVLSGSDGLDTEITSCLGSDMMSDVLAFAQPKALMITGLTNSQSVRTADIAEAAAILYVRGKKPDQNTLELAKELSIPILSTELGLFEACGILFNAGLKGIC